MSNLEHIDGRIDDLTRSIDKLRRDLKVWRTWDIEYEELKEELQTLPDSAGVEELTALSTSFDGEYLDSDAIREIFGLDKPPLRTPARALRLLEQRQDYVQRNTTTLSTQLAKAEFALADMAPADQQTTLHVSDTAADKLPIYEIVEQLDENGNVIETSMYRPDSAREQIEDMLSKAGVSLDASEVPSLESSKPTSGQNTLEETTTSARIQAAVENASGTPLSPQSMQSESIRKKSVSFAQDTKPPSEPSRPSSAASMRSETKSVSFSDVVEFQPAEEPRVSFSPVVEEIEADASMSKKQRELSKTFAPGTRVIELDDEDKAIDNIVIPDNETPEEAQLRRQMLEYSLNEVGSIVAELELEEDYSDEDFADDSQGDYTDGTTLSDVEDDDEHGRTRTRVISDEYRKRMLDLEKKLDARMIANIGPDMPSGGASSVLDPRHAHRLVVRDSNSGAERVRDGADSDPGSKKSVRFADTLDVRRVDDEAMPRSAQPVMSNVVESPDFMVPAPPQGKPKQSRFKAMRQAAGASQPVAEEVRPILLENVVERPISDSPRAPGSGIDDDSDDPEIRRRQLASEYYRLRNSIIRNQEGGFKESPEEAYEPLMEEKDGKVRKVSRFRAARVGGYRPDDGL